MKIVSELRDAKHNLDIFKDLDTDIILDALIEKRARIVKKYFEVDEMTYEAYLADFVQVQMEIQKICRLK